MDYRANLPEIANEYLAYSIAIKNRSPKTIQEYAIDLQIFFKFMKKYFNNSLKELEIRDIDIHDVNIEFVKKITISDLYAYFEYITTVRDNNSATRCRKATSIRMFFKFLKKRNYIEKDPTIELDMPKKASALPRYLDLSEAIKLLDSVDGQYKERNYAIITIFLNCGIRLSELVNINLTDIKSDNVRIVGKGNKERTIYLNSACKDAISSYLHVRPNDGVIDKDALFLSRLKKRINTKTVQWLVKKFIDISGLDPKIYSVHKLRHTAATLMYQNGVDVRALQAVLGHENLGTTQIYTHISSKTVEDAINANPLSKKKSK